MGGLARLYVSGVSQGPDKCVPAAHLVQCLESMHCTQLAMALLHSGQASSFVVLPRQREMSLYCVVDVQDPSVHSRHLVFGGVEHAWQMRAWLSFASFVVVLGL